MLKNTSTWATIGLLVLSNTFMTLAWYGHLKFSTGKKITVLSLILISWGIAFFEYCLQVPANRIGYQAYGGPFNLWQLKIMQEALNLLVFLVFVLDLLRRDHRGLKMALFRPGWAFFRSRSWAMLPQKAFAWTKNSSFFPPR